MGKIDFSAVLQSWCKSAEATAAAMSNTLEAIDRMRRAELRLRRQELRNLELGLWNIPFFSSKDNERIKLYERILELKS